MRKIVIAVLAVLIVAIVLNGCAKSSSSFTCTYDACDNPAPAGEVTQLETYLSSMGVTTATKHCSGMYYQIISAGTDATSASVCSFITVNYIGSYTDGQVFDHTSGTPYSNMLIGLIEGWKKGIPLIKKGGKIKLFIPPSLGYGVNPTNGIRANAILVFDIELLDVQ